jgi:hypothetical protein
MMNEELKNEYDKWEEREEKNKIFKLKDDQK